MPNRIISEKCRTSPTLDALSSDAERTFWRLMTVVDDYGRFDADPRVVLSTCFPLRVGIWKPEKMSAVLQELIRAVGDDQPLVEVYVVKGRRYGQILSFLTYQRRRDSKSKFPGPDDGEKIMPPRSAASCGESPPNAAKCGESPQVAASSVFVSESVSGSRKRIRIRESNPARQGAADPVTALKAFGLTAELTQWAQREGIPNLGLYLEEFRDYWLSVGGLRKNGRPIRDWPATFRNWLRGMKGRGQLRAAETWKDGFLAQEGSA